MRCMWTQGTYGIVASYERDDDGFFFSTLHAIHSADFERGAMFWA
jgi:uncharacterized protein with GYD domain